MKNVSKGDLKVLPSDILVSTKEYNTPYVYEFWGKNTGFKKKSLKTTETSRNEDRSKFMYCQRYTPEAEELCKNPQSLQVTLNSRYIFLIKAKNPKHLPYPYVFHPQKRAYLEPRFFRSSLQTQRVHLTPLCTLTGRWRNDVEPDFSGS